MPCRARTQAATAEARARAAGAHLHHLLHLLPPLLHVSLCAVPVPVQLLLPVPLLQVQEEVRAPACAPQRREAPWAALTNARAATIEHSAEEISQLENEGKGQPMATAPGDVVMNPLAEQPGA